MKPLLFPISTEHLLLRPAELRDAAALLELNRHEEVTRYVHDVPWQNIAQAELWINKQQREQYEATGMGRYVAELKDSGEVIGWCGLKLRPEHRHVDLGYRFHPAHWGKGYATEASEVMLLHGFHTLGHKRLVGWAQTQNPASIRVFEKLNGRLVKTWMHAPGLEIAEYEFIRPGANMQTPVLFRSSRLDFREITASDTGVNFALNTDPDVVRWTGNTAFASVNVCRDFYAAYGENYTKYGYARWMATLRDTDECIGWCGLKFYEPRNCVDLGYRLFQRFWGKGLASEAAIASMKFGKEQLGLDEIHGFAYRSNPASIRILEKCGMHYTGSETEETDELLKYVISLQAITV
ncbi:MAG: GNAT family N-acetyltransferase [Bacteroidetes bacterium]|nr:GNAT family N-acetyltransferase [Bacteroidota bacterium]